MKPLTPREQQVLNCLRRGLFNKEIAAELGIKVKTVRVHCTAMYAKLGVRNRLEAVVKG